jgi:hypothetical protein
MRNFVGDFHASRRALVRARERPGVNEDLFPAICRRNETEAFFVPLGYRPANAHQINP